MEEVWKDIYFYDFRTDEWIDYRGYYQVRNYGRVKSLERIDSNGHKVKEKIKKTTMKNNGYYHLVLYKNGKSKTFHIHKLVAFMFVPNDCYDKNVINHKDEDKSNNIYSNLEWCTQQYNNLYGTHKERSDAHQHKKPVVMIDIYTGEVLGVYESIKDCSRRISEDNSLKYVWAISNACRFHENNPKGRNDVINDCTFYFLKTYENLKKGDKNELYV